MLAQTLLALGAFAATTVSAQAYGENNNSNNTCEASPYRGLGCLASNTAAADDCSSRVPAVTVTTTSTTSVLSEVTEVPSVTSAVVSQVTLNVTKVETSTETVTCSQVSTSYSTAIETTCLSSTITTYTSQASPTGQREKRQASESACIASGLETLSSLNNETLSNACSCLDLAAPTETATVYVTSFVDATVTSYSGLAPTTTAEFIDRITVTETVSPNATIIPVTSTKTTTETITISLAAPTYEPNFGPKAGCSNLNAGRAESLDNKIDCDSDAIAACKDICDQEPTCKFLYVQRLFADYADTPSYYQCYMNDKDLDEKRDLICGRPEGQYGVANGFEVCDRGVEEKKEDEAGA